MTFFVDLLLKTTVLIAAGAVAGLVLHRASAAARHVAWTLVAAGCLLLPVMITVLPEWRLDALPDLRPVVLTRPAAEAAVEQPAATVIPIEEQAELTTGETAARLHETASPTIPWYLWVWGAGTLAVLLVFVVGARHLHGVASRACVIDDPAWCEDAAEIAKGAGLLSDDFRLLRGTDRITPMTWGVWRPVVVLPRDCVDWTAEQRREVLLHELAHVRRRDCLTQWLANLACIVYWYHPLVWWTARRMLVERERACDDQVIRGGAAPSGYAKHLLEIARSLGASRPAVPAGVAMARRSQVSGRLLSVLDPACNRGQPRRGHVLTALAFAAAVLLPLAAVQPGRTAFAAQVGLQAGSWDPAGERTSAAAASAAAGWSLEEIREMLDETNARLIESVDDQDPESIAEMYSPDAVAFGMGGAERHGRRQIEELYRSLFDAGYRKLVVDSVELRRLQDDLIYELGRYTYDHKDGRTKLNGRYMSIWRYEDGRWLVYRDLSNI